MKLQHCALAFLLFAAVSQPRATAQNPVKESEDPNRAAALEKLCKAAMVKDGNALDELEKKHLNLHKHIVTAIVDNDSFAVSRAIQEIEKVGAPAQGAWVVIEYAMRRLNFPRTVASSGVPALATLAPGDTRVVDRLLQLTTSLLPANDPSAVRVPAVQALARIASRHPASQTKIVAAIALRFRDDAGPLEAVAALGEVARTCPQVRGLAAEALTIALLSKDIKLPAVKAIAHCGAAVGDKTIAALKALRLDETMAVRDEAAVTLKEIDRQKLIVGRLKKFGVEETSSEPGFYKLAFAGIEKPDELVNLRDPIRQTPAIEAVYQFILHIAKTADENDGDRAKLRSLAMALLVDAAEVHRGKRTELLPVFIAGVRDTDSEGPALKGIACCGVPGVRALKEAKSSQIDKLEPLLIVRARDFTGDDRLEALGGLEDLGAKSRDLHTVTTRIVSASQPLAIRRLAAKLLQTVGNAQLELAEPLWRAYQGKVKETDEQCDKLIIQALKNIGINPASEGGYQGSVIIHPKANEAQRTDAYRAAIDPQVIGSFGRDADPKARKEVTVRWWQASLKSVQTSANCLVITKHMPAEASEVVMPYLLGQMASYARDPSTIRMRIDDLLQALENMGKACGPEAKAALQKIMDSAAVRDLKVRARVREVAALIDGNPLPKKKEVNVAEQEKKEGFEPLFNGKDLTGWLAVGKQTGNLVEEGVLIVRKGVNLYSKKEYGSFHLKTEFRVEHESFQILGFHVPPQPRPELMSPQFGILIVDNLFRWRAGQFTTGTLEHSPSEGKLAKAPADCFTQRGEWQEMEIIVNKGQIEILVNQKIAVKGDLAALAKVQIAAVRPVLQRGRGHFVIASDSKQVEYRNMRIRELK